MAKPIKKCMPFTHVYPARPTGRDKALGFFRRCLNCGKIKIM